jgi:hypothetical protein
MAVFKLPMMNLVFHTNPCINLKISAVSLEESLKYPLIDIDKIPHTLISLMRIVNRETQRASLSTMMKMQRVSMKMMNNYLTAVVAITPNAKIRNRPKVLVNSTKRRLLTRCSALTKTVTQKRKRNSNILLPGLGKVMSVELKFYL